MLDCLKRWIKMLITLQQSVDRKSERGGGRRGEGERRGQEGRERETGSRGEERREGGRERDKGDNILLSQALSNTHFQTGPISWQHLLTMTSSMRQSANKRSTLVIQTHLQSPTSKHMRLWGRHSRFKPSEDHIPKYKKCRIVKLLAENLDDFEFGDDF